MIKLNSNGLLSTYIGKVTGVYYPKTVCNLVNYTLLATFLYVLYTLIAISAISMCITAWVNGFSIASLTEFYKSEPMAHITFAVAIFWHIFVVIHTVKFLFGEKIAAYNERRFNEYHAEYDEMSDKLWDKEITREQFDTWLRASKYNKKSKLATLFEVLGAIWKRFSDKTCVMIDWQKKDR